MDKSKVAAIAARDAKKKHGVDIILFRAKYAVKNILLTPAFLGLRLTVTVRKNANTTPTEVHVITSPIEEGTTSVNNPQ